MVLRPRNLVLLTLVALLGLAALLSAWLVPPRYHWHAAQQALQQGKLDVAQQHLDVCLQAWPRDASLHLLAARTARRRDALDEAEKHLTECQRIQGVTPASSLEWMLLRAQQGDLDSVAAPLAQLLKDNHPDSVGILEALAKGYRASYRITEMLDIVDALLAKQPDHAQAHLWRGMAAEALGRPFDALAEYRKAVDLDPGSDLARQRLADSLLANGHPREALAHYGCLRKRQPDNPDVLLGMARCQVDDHELDDARRLLDTLLEQHPDHVPGLVERARLAFFTGSSAEADVLLGKALRHAPQDREALRVQLLYLEAEGKTEEAHACRAQLDRVEADLARVNTLMLRTVDAPQDPAPRYEIGMIMLRNGRQEAGVGWLYAALQADPHYQPSHAALADYFEHAGQPDRAAPHRRAQKP
jgi:tetratricopeptide (TPR) repeat protein